MALNYLGMAGVNFFTYSIIPFYINRSGATLLNLSNVTTIIWSMLFDILLFGSPFYPLCLLGFAIELIAIIVFSTSKPVKATRVDLEVNEVTPLFKDVRQADDDYASGSERQAEEFS